MNDCSEYTLFKKGFLYILLPIFILAVLGIIYPYIYVFVPSYNNGTCLCSFIWDLNNGKQGYVIFKTFESYNVMLVISNLSYYSTQMAIVIFLINMIYKIRHIEDKSCIKRECVIVGVLWVCGSSIG
jgi:hypothetical protein